MWECRSPLDVVDLDQLRQLRLRGPPSARRGPRAAPARCRRSRGARRRRSSVSQSSTSPLSASVMPCSETERPRATASSRSCTLWALEPVKCWSRLPKASGATIRRSTEIAVVGLGADAVGAGVAGGGDQRVARRGARRARPAPRRWRSGRCPCRSRPSAGPSRRPRPGWRPGARAAPRPAPRRSGATFESSTRPGRLARLAEPLERGEDVLLDLRAEAFELADLLALGRLLEVLEGGDSELVEEPARGFRAQARDPRHLDQASAGTSPSASPRRGSRRSRAGRRSFPPASCRRRGSRSPGPRRPARRPRPGSRGSPGRRCRRRAPGI